MPIDLKRTIRQLVFLIAALFCLSPLIDPPIALLLGFILAITIGHPFIELNNRAINILLKLSVIGLGFGMNLYQAMDAGKEGFIFSVSSITITLLAGWLFSKWLNIDGKLSFLISGGTAICGGSAIVAISPVINANEKQVSIALGTIFILNSLALFIFPVIGHGLNMTEHQFGLWCAIAIHDTSSVVGAASKYGADALQVATTVKLERVLWIVPLSVAAMLLAKGGSKKIVIPYFIGFFIVAMCLNSYFPAYKNLFSAIAIIAKKGLTLTLFLIGAGLSFNTIKEVGIKPLLLGILLWFLISVGSIAAIMITR